MLSVYQPRRPRASPLLQIIHHGWDAFLTLYEKFHRKSLGPLDPAAVTTVESFLRRRDHGARRTTVAGDQGMDAR